jgi:hypothetical protein
MLLRPRSQSTISSLYEELREVSHVPGYMKLNAPVIKAQINNLACTNTPLEMRAQDGVSCVQADAILLKAQHYLVGRGEESAF